MNTFGFVLLLISTVEVAKFFFNLNADESMPQPHEETCWGSDDPNAEDKNIHPLAINISEEVLEDLNHRLKITRNLAPPSLIARVVDLWLTKYNWREREKFLNQFPQFKTKIQCLDIHYLHVKPQNVPNGVKVLPLLLLHGFPSSVREFYEIIPRLVRAEKDTDFVFEVIVPSLPGHGFSQAAAKAGLEYPQMAALLKKLMTRLGFDNYYVHGNANVASYMAIFFAEEIKGLHSNGCWSNSKLSKLKLFLGSLWSRFVIDEKYKPRIHPLSEYFADRNLPVTNLDTIGVALNDSPVGLLSFILENLGTKSDADDESLKKVLDNVMLYWTTNSITSSIKIYVNTKKNVAGTQIDVPTACAVFDKARDYQPPSIFSDRYTKLVQVSEYSGGQFSLFEGPDLLAKDIRLAVSKFERPANSE